MNTFLSINNEETLVTIKRQLKSVLRVLEMRYDSEDPNERLSVNEYFENLYYTINNCIELLDEFWNSTLEPIREPELAEIERILRNMYV